MLLFRALLLLALTSGPALALSCFPYSPQRAFGEAQQSPDPYIVVHGQIDFNPADMPGRDPAAAIPPARDNFLHATFTGFSLTGRGFTARFVRQIRVNVQCLGPWCGVLEPGGEYLAFLRKEPGGSYLLEVDPCYGKAFANPGEEVLAAMRACLLGEDCVQPIPVE